MSDYIVIHVPRGGDAMDISQLVSSITWGGGIMEAARKLEIELVYGEAAYIPRYEIRPGSVLLLRNEERELIRGVVVSTDRGLSGTMSITSYEHSWYLLRSTATYRFSGMGADAIARRVCSDAGVPVGSLAAPGVTLPKLILRDTTLFDAIIIAYTEASKRTGKRYQVRMNEGKLHVVPKGGQRWHWVLSADTNISDAQLTESIEAMSNRIVITNDADDVLARVEDSSLIAKYGLLQHSKQEGDVTAGEARTIAQTLLKELGKLSQTAQLEVTGIDDVQAGDAVEVQEPITGLSGTYYVESDEHTIEGGHHMMSLSLAWTDEVLAKDAPEDPTKPAKGGDAFDDLFQ